MKENYFLICSLFVFQVDGTIQSVLYDNSIDYAVKFQDLAAHISGNSDSSLLRKTDSSGWDIPWCHFMSHHCLTLCTSLMICLFWTLFIFCHLSLNLTMRTTLCFILKHVDALSSHTGLRMYIFMSAEHF